MKQKQTKQLILDKSLDIFTKNSFFSVSMQELANALNIKKSLIYYYFESKSILYHEAISQYLNGIVNQFEIIFSNKYTSSQKINELSQLYLRELEKEHSILSGSIDKNKLDKSITNIVSNTQKKIIGYFESIISEGVKKGEFKKLDPKKSSLAMIGYIEKNKQYNNKLEKNWFDFLLK